MERLGRYPGRTLVGAIAIASGAGLLVTAHAGFAEVADAFGEMHLGWLAVAFGAQFVAFAGYTLAYRRILAAFGGPRLKLSLVARLVATGFGAFAPGGGFAIDYRAISSLEDDERTAATRVLALGGLEYVVVAPAACACAIAILLNGGDVTGSVLWPWAIAVPVGFAIGFSLAPWAQRAVAARRGKGWRMLADALGGIELLRMMAASPIRFLPALLGIAAYWAGELLSLWASLRAIGAELTLGPLVLGLATGYALTRRSLPLAGAGVTEVLLTLALTWVGLGLPEAVAGMILYRLFSFVLPMLPALWAHREVSQLIEPDLATESAHPDAPLDRSAASRGRAG